MAEAIAAFPENPQVTQTLVWGTRQVRFRVTYRDRPGAWYFSIYELDDVTPIITGRRVSPRWNSLLGQALGDTLARDRFFYVFAGVGTDGPYPRADLNQNGPIQMLLVLNSDLPATSVDPNLAVTVTVSVP